MVAALTLPIRPGHPEFTVKVDGSALPLAHHVLGVSVSLVVNRIASARVVFADGSASGGGFPLAGGDVLQVGRQIEILAGGEAQVDSLFQGIIVRHQIKVRRGSAELVVECRDPAMKLAAKRTCAAYFELRDSDVIATLLEKHGVTADVADTELVHEQLVQCDTSDWEFLLSRARANGLLVWQALGKLFVQVPPSEGEPVCDLHYGSTLLEFDAEYDARDQFSSVTSTSWDAAQQAVSRATANAPTLVELGDLSAGALAAVASAGARELRRTTLDPAEAQALVDAEWADARIHKLNGRAKCDGFGKVRPGCFVTLSGLGKHYDGKAFVTGVKHEYSTTSGWKTHVQFGGVDRRAGGQPADALKSSAARVSGLQIGVVVSNEDPSGQWRVRVRLPLVPGSDDGVWVRVVSLDAGKQRGFFFRPDVGDEVVVGFLDEDPRQGLLLGMLHSSAKPAPFQASDENDHKGYVSRSGVRLDFDDAARKLEISTPGGKRLTLSDMALSDKGGEIRLEDEHENKIQMDSKGVVIQSASALTLRARTEIKLDAGTSLSAKGGTEARLEGGTQVELTSGALTKVKGAMVQIN